MTKIKRGVSILLMLTMLCSIFCISGVSADAATTISGSCGTNATYTLNKSTGKMVIEAKSGKDGYIKDNFLSSLSSANQKAIKTLVIKGRIIRVGKYAFQNSTTIKTIKINTSDGITVRYGAFLANTALTSLTVSTSGNISFLEYAFSECKNLEDVDLDVGSAYFGEYSFLNCKKIEKIVVPTLAGYINEGAFSGCTSLKKVNIKNTSSIHVCKYAFNNCKNLTTFANSKKVDYLEEYAFSGCTDLEEFNFSSKLTSVPKYCFSFCKSLTSISIPKNVNYLKEYSFYNCTGLKTVTLYKNTKVERYAFKNCTCSFKYKS